MNNHESYMQVINRLVEYRNQEGLLQSEMGEKFGVTQSHYCKLESGLSVISRKSLKCFAEAGGDALWLLTGKKSSSGVLDNYFLECTFENERLRMTQALLWGTEQGLRISKMEMEISVQKSYSLLSYDTLKNGLVWKKIRELEGLTQIQMARILEIDIKRYRKIEKEEIEEDAAILCTLYSKLCYSPLIIMDKTQFCLMQLNAIWEKFDRNLLRKLLEYVSVCFGLLKSESL